MTVLVLDNPELIARAAAGFITSHSTTRGKPPTGWPLGPSTSRDPMPGPEDGPAPMAPPIHQQAC